MDPLTKIYDADIDVSIFVDWGLNLRYPVIEVSPIILTDEE